MAITHAAYGSFMNNLLTGAYTLDIQNDTINAALITSAYTPDLETHALFSDITGQVTGTGYTSGGNTLTGINVNYSAGVVTVTAADSTWSSLTAVFRYAVIYQVQGVSDSNLIGLVDFGSDRTYNAAPFTLSAPNGLVVLGRAS